MTLLINVATWLFLLSLTLSCCGAVRSNWTQLILLYRCICVRCCTLIACYWLAIRSEVIDHDILVDYLWWWLQIILIRLGCLSFSNKRSLTTLFNIISCYLSICSICLLIIDTLESLTTSASVPTVLCSLQLSPPSPNSV